MCGIAGLIRGQFGPLEAIEAMLDAQSHRGPDGRAFLIGHGRHAAWTQNLARVDCQGQIAIGHLRLAILDTTDAGLQPMATPSGRLWLAHNGEIYNYIELRLELQKCGYEFRTGTDSEVVLAAYEEWGTDCFARFNGMWAMALWDLDRRRVVLSRDRLGIKPLHVARTADGLVFASEIKGILASGLVRPRLNREAAAQFLRWSHVNSDEQTMFEGVTALTPGTFATIDLDNPSRLQESTFWDLASAVDKPGTTDIHEAASEFAQLFESSVALRMRSDVVVGSSLSGGLDSSSVVAIASSLVNTPMSTFTSNSDQPEHDEREYAAILNSAVGATGHSVLPTPAGFVAEHANIAWHQEEPYLSTGIYAQWSVMADARRNGVKVLLDGQGGDEVLCGYRKYYFFYLQSLARQYRALDTIREAAGLVRSGDPAQWRISQGIRYLPNAFRFRTWSLAESLNQQFRPDWDAAQARLGLTTSGVGGIAHRQVADLTSLSIPALLRYEDRNSMAHSIEARVPFLDHRLVEYLVSLPDELKMRGGRTKDVLRVALRGRVPDSILDRRTKLGFNTPLTKWMTGELYPFFQNHFRSSDFAAGAVLEPTVLAVALRDRTAAKDSNALRQLFRAYSLDQWMREFEVEV